MHTIGPVLFEEACKRGLPIGEEYWFRDKPPYLYHYFHENARWGMFSIMRLLFQMFVVVVILIGSTGIPGIKFFIGNNLIPNMNRLMQHCISYFRGAKQY